MTAKIAGLREQQKAATRAELYRFGFELFLKQGFADTTIEQIVEPLGIAKRTFFRYFATKEELVFAWYEDKTAELVAELKGRPRKEKPFTAVCETLASLLKRYDAAPEMAFALVRLLKDNPTLGGRSFEKQTVRERALAEALIEREGVAKLPALKARIVVGVVMTAFGAALDEWYASGGKADLRPIVETAFSMAKTP